MLVGVLSGLVLFAVVGLVAFGVLDLDSSLRFGPSAEVALDSGVCISVGLGSDAGMAVGVGDGAGDGTGVAGVDGAGGAVRLGADTGLWLGWVELVRGGCDSAAGAGDRVLGAGAVGGQVEQVRGVRGAGMAADLAVSLGSRDGDGLGVLIVQFDGVSVAGVGECVAFCAGAGGVHVDWCADAAGLVADLRGVGVHRVLLLQGDAGLVLGSRDGGLDGGLGVGIEGASGHPVLAALPGSHA